MATPIVPEVAPLPTKDVRRNRETRDFDAYLVMPDGTEQYLGSRARSWDAEALCDEAYYTLLMERPTVEADDDEIAAAAHADELAIYAAEWDAYAAELATLVEPATPAATPTITTEEIGLCAVARCGGVALWLDRVRPADLVLVKGIHTDGCSWDALRDLYALLSLPQHQQLMGLDAPPAAPVAPRAPAVRVEPYTWDDPSSPDHGQPVGTRFLVGEGASQIEVYVPVVSSPADDRPMLYAFGGDALPLDAVLAALPALLALLADPQVQAARTAWQTQQIAA